MSDPAIEAANRACDYEPYVRQSGTFELMTDAAREALKPIREAIEKIPAGLDAIDIYDELLHIYNLTGGHCKECRKE